MFPARSQFLWVLMIELCVRRWGVVWNKAPISQVIHFCPGWLLPFCFYRVVFGLISTPYALHYFVELSCVVTRYVYWLLVGDFPNFIFVLVVHSMCCLYTSFFLLCVVILKPIIFPAPGFISNRFFYCCLIVRFRSYRVLSTSFPAWFRRIAPNRSSSFALCSPIKSSELAFIPRDDWRNLTSVILQPFQFVFWTARILTL